MSDPPLEAPARGVVRSAGRAVGSAFAVTGVAALALMAAPMSAAAQRATGRARPAPEQDITVTGERPRSSCDGGAGARAIDYACLNRALKTAATKGPPPPSAADVAADATTPSRVGTFSHSATAQRMGRNFGHSAQPYRPPAPVFTDPVRSAGPR